MRDRSRRHRPEPDEVLVALDETWHRWSAYHVALAALEAGELPAGSETDLALWELQLACDSWRARFVDALVRRGIDLDDVLAAA